MGVGDSIHSDSGNWAPSKKAAPAGRCCLSLQKGQVLTRQRRDEPMSNGQCPGLVFGVGQTRDIMRHVCRRMQDKGEWGTVALGKLLSI